MTYKFTGVGGFIARPRGRGGAYTRGGMMRHRTNLVNMARMGQIGQMPPLPLAKQGLEGEEEREGELVAGDIKKRRRKPRMKRPGLQDNYPAYLQACTFCQKIANLNVHLL